MGILFLVKEKYCKTWDIIVVGTNESTNNLIFDNPQRLLLKAVSQSLIVTKNSLME